MLPKTIRYHIREEKKPIKEQILGQTCQFLKFWELVELQSFAKSKIIYSEEKAVLQTNKRDTVVVHCTIMLQATLLYDMVSVQSTFL